VQQKESEKPRDALARNAPVGCLLLNFLRIAYFRWRSQKLLTCRYLATIRPLEACGVLNRLKAMRGPNNGVTCDWRDDAARTQLEAALGANAALRVQAEQLIAAYCCAESGGVAGLPMESLRSGGWSKSTHTRRSPS
jgi:hypothetical protein